MRTIIGALGLMLVIFGVLASLLIVRDTYLVGPIHLAVGGVLILGWALARARAFASGPAIKRHDSLRPLIVKGGAVALLTLAALVVAARFLLQFIDFTEQKVHSLHPSFAKVVDSLAVPVEVRVFSLGGQVPPGLRSTLELAGQRSAKFVWTAVDPEKEPQQVEQFAVKQLPTIIVRRPDDSEKGGARVSGGIDETQLVRMVQAVARPVRPAVYFILGHGERDSQDTKEGGLSFFRDLLEAQNVKTKPLVLLGIDAVPPDATLVVLAAPQREFVAREQRIIDDYIDRGGNLLVMSEPGSSPEIERLGKRFGITPLQGTLAQQFSKSFSGTVADFQVVAQAGPSANDVTVGLKNPMIFPTAGAFAVAPDGPAAVVLSTPEQTWLQTRTDRAVFEPGDATGPFPLVAVAQTGNASSQTSGGRAGGKGRAVFVADADIVSNMYLPKLGNRDLMLNLVRWAHHEDLSWSIPPRGFRKAELHLAPSVVQGLYIVGGLLVPELVICLGLGVYYFRSVSPASRRRARAVPARSMSRV